MTVTESTVEEVTVSWFGELGYTVLHGPSIAPGELFAERKNSEQVVLERRLRDALLPKLISGEIRVKDAERIVGRAV